MRISKTLMTGAVAAVVSAGSANAGVVDPFTTAATFGGNTAVWTPISGGLFAERQAQRFNSSSGTIDGSGSWVAVFGSGSNNTSLNYRVNSGGGTIDLSGIASMSFSLSGVTGSFNLNWYFVDANGVNAAQAATQVPVSANGTQTFNFSTAVPEDPSFDWTQIKTMTVQMIGTGSGGFTVSNFNFTAVPAPGALALLGAAGLVGTRRRR